MRNSLTLIKQRLLLRALDAIPDCGRHALVIQEADVACGLAARTSFPELVLPCLFEERVGLALDFEQRRLNYYWRHLRPHPVVVSRGDCRTPAPTSG
jgi:hypothetical protein